MVQSNYVANGDLAPHPPSYEFRGYEVQLSWIRVFEDSGGTRYYQWMVGTSPSVGASAARITTLNDIHTSLSGSLSVYWPIPENLTSPLSESEIGKSGAEFDFVSWIAENANHNNNLESGTDYAVVYDYWGSIYWIIAIPIVATAAVIGGIIGFRRWKRKT